MQKIKSSKNLGRFDVSRREAAELLSMSGQTISNYVDAGLLSARKCGRFLFLCREEVMELIPTAKNTAAAERELIRAEKEYRKQVEEYDKAIRQLTIDGRFRDDVSSKFTREIVPGIIACFKNEDICENNSASGQRLINVCIDYFSGMHIPQIAEKHKLSREGVRQIIRKGVRRISSVGTYPQLIKTIRELRREIAAQKDIINSLKAQNAEVRAMAGIRQNNATTRMKENVLNKSIAELNLSVRAQNCCRAAGIATIRGLCQYTMDEIKSMHLVGAKTADELNDVLKTHGLGFKQPENRFVGI
jgi:predicted DNA-binding protein YlxM (UPF0122 family)